MLMDTPLKRGLGRLGLAAALSLSFCAVAQDVNKVQATLHADQPGPTVSRNIFGQFAEHLGTGIYGGIWVGEDSRIPNTNGYRNDVVAALRKLEVPVVRWPGGCSTNTTGAKASVRAPNARSRSTTIGAASRRRTPSAPTSS